MTEAFTLEEHRHRFAVWAASRASQRGFTKLSRLRAALEDSGIREALTRAETYRVTVKEFDVLHRRWCTSICGHLKKAGVSNVAYGRSAKLVAVYLKAIVTMGAKWDTSLGRVMHPPVDRILLQTLARSQGERRLHSAAWRKTSWTRLDRPGYENLIAQLRDLLATDVPFWTIEKYWQPSEAEEADAK